MSATLVETVGSITLTPAQKQAEQRQQKSGKPLWFSQTGKPASEYEYQRYLPVWTQEKLPPLQPFEHTDPGHEALKHKDPQGFLSGADVEDITPNFGSEVDGIQLSKLDSVGRAQLGVPNCAPDHT